MSISRLVLNDVFTLFFQNIDKRIALQIIKDCSVEWSDAGFSSPQNYRVICTT